MSPLPAVVPAPGITWTFNPARSFYTGGVVASEIPWGYPVAIGGHPYEIDPAKYQRNTLPILRQPQDQFVEPGEQSLNTEGLWRRSTADWVLGAGQTYIDDIVVVAYQAQVKSNRNQFKKSKGIDPWTVRQLTLLKDTANRWVSANTNLKLVQTNGFLYLIDGNEVYSSANPGAASPTWTAANIHHGLGAVPVTDITVAGGNVYAAVGANGVSRTALGAASSVQHSTYAAVVVRFVNGRLIAARAGDISEINGAGVATSIPAQPTFDTAFAWVDIAAAPKGIYAAGNSGTVGTIWYIGTDTATGNLLPPIHAGALPYGETINRISYYQGIMVLATNRGLRLAQVNADNGISHGPLIIIPNGVVALEPQGEFVWFSWSNYDSASTGLGRLNLARFSESLVPAYASDLMTTGQGTVTGTATFAGLRYFAVGGLGVFGETATYVAQGIIDSGLIRFGTSELKASVGLDVRTLSLAGSWTAGVVLEDGTSVVNAGGTSTVGSLGPTSPLRVQSIAESVQVRLTLNATADGSGAPVIRRWTLSAAPLPFRADEIIVPIIMRSEILAGNDTATPRRQDTAAEFAFLKGLERSRTLVRYQEGTRGYTVIVDRIQVLADKWNDQRSFFEGLVNVRLLTVDSSQN